MLQTESEVVIADNSWAKIGQIIRILKGSTARKATIGDRVVIAVKSVSTSSTYKKGDVARAVIVRTKKGVGRKDGSYLKFADNAVALINKDDGLVKEYLVQLLENLEAGFKDVATLAEEVI